MLTTLTLNLIVRCILTLTPTVTLAMSLHTAIPIPVTTLPLNLVGHGRRLLLRLVSALGALSRRISGEQWAVASSNESRSLDSLGLHRVLVKGLLGFTEDYSTGLGFR